MPRHFMQYGFPVLCWAVMIFAISNISSFPREVQPVFNFDKLAHSVEYAVFGFLLARAFRNSDREKMRKNFRIFAIICAVIYGASDEAHQYFVPRRSASMLDLGSDAVGAMIGQLLYKKKIADKENIHD
ncbi:MAG: VanZ family protein [Candidatus Omnitrophica bacterium]|nr:VanZ family protein [Candidatus Omnitrophota bacterium]